MILNRSKSYIKNNHSFQNNFCNTTSNFYSVNNQDNKKIRKSRLLSSNFYAIKFSPKLFSLIDIDDKITNSRGTSLPIQFKRLTEEEKIRHFGFSYRQEYNYKLSLIKNFLNNIHPSVYKKNRDKSLQENDKNNLNKDKNKNRDKNNKKKLEIKINNSNKNNILEENNNEKNESIKSKNKKAIISKTESNEDKLRIKNRNDCFLPKGYPNYEILVNNPKLLIKQIKNDPFAGKLPDYSLKVIKQKSYASDIFFNKPQNIKENLYNKKIKRHNHQSSDIFNLNYEEENLLKTGENFLFKIKNKDNYYITRESGSKWSPKSSFPTLINCPSIEYNILSPGKKNFVLTKEKVLTELENKKIKYIKEKKLDKKPSFFVNYLNPIYRQKGLGEFIDITRNGGNNTGRDFINCYNKNPSCFCKKDETCSTFYNSYLYYKDLISKPFVLDPSLKLKK